jgi:hypothetical protein
MAKTFFGRLIADIVSLFGSIFHSVLNGAEKTYNNLPQATKDALLHGSGVMAFITQEVGMLPSEIRTGILAKFPDLNEAELEAGLYAVANGLKLNPTQNNLDDTIAKLQTYINSFQGNTWNSVVQGAAEVLAVFLAPAGTKFGAIASLIEYIYQTFFAKKIN